jgi:hypothetical protein
VPSFWSSLAEASLVGTKSPVLVKFELVWFHNRSHEHCGEENEDTYHYAILPAPVIESIPRNPSRQHELAQDYKPKSHPKDCGYRSCDEIHASHALMRCNIRFIFASVIYLYMHHHWCNLLM